MKRIALALCLALAGSAAAFASNMLYGPWVHNVTETSFTVLWVTAERSLDYVQVIPDDGTAFESCERERHYQSCAGRRIFTRFHSVTVDSLQPGTTYRYRVIGKVVEDSSSPYRISYGAERLISDKSGCSVKTLDSKAATCRFSLFSDIHCKDARFTTLAKGIDIPNTDFIVLCGDISSHSQEIDSVARHTFGPVGEQIRRLPVFFARGNHEGRGDDFYKVPLLFPTSTGEFYYTFRQGPAAFIVLDAGEDKPDKSCEYSGTAEYDAYRLRQLEWMKTAVNEPSFASAPVKICLMHIPPFNWKSSWYSQRWAAGHFGPVLEEAGIDVTLCGHHHKWIYSAPGEDGTAFTVLANSNTERMDVEVTASSIEVRTYDEAGKLCHEWSLKK